MIDFHCHLDLYPKPGQIVDGCKDRGMFVLSVTTTPSAWQGTSALVVAEGRIHTALGLHPQIAHERIGEIGLFEELLPRTRFVGEIGLDGSPELRPHWGDQLKVFESILAACCRDGGRILSVHSRRASKAVLDCLDNHNGAGTAILHWFSGGVRDLERAVTLGCWFSVGPAMLRSKKGRQLVARMPQERVLTESDGPFAQLGGRSIYPWEVKAAEDELSVLWNMSQRDVETKLEANLKQLINSELKK